MNSNPELVDALLIGKRDVAEGVVELRFRDPSAQNYPEPGPGAHIDVRTPSGERRSYSLTRGPTGHDGDYVIAVALEPEGRGGSRSLHHSTMAGMTMQISAAVDTFPFEPAPEYLLIAGGIGITPIRSMYYEIARAGRSSVRLVYLTRSRLSAPYLGELISHSRDGAEVLVHTTDDHNRERFDLWTVLEHPGNQHVYCCAAPTVLEAVRRSTAHWRASRVHFEDFVGVPPIGDSAVPFTAVWEPTMTEVDVGANESLLDALSARGIDVPMSCRTGTCGTCCVGVVSGVVDHRDVVLDDKDRQTMMTVCVSRSSNRIMIKPVE
ncbi:PDR/VanB family oxidoreductase [Rhodococcus ruber]|uniref:PDR/VanB family oxidoreductase n=1 Tax=Rhodococcus ruber TaxID=1830 RepID=UPI003B220AFE